MNVRAVSKGASLNDGPNESSKIVRAPSNLPVVIGYDLQKDWTGPLVHPKQFHPVLMPEYFEFTGSNALLRLKLKDGVTETASFDWQKLPADWVVATSFGVSTSTADRCQTYSGPWTDVVNGLYTAGDYRIRRFQIGRRPAVLAVRGVWTFTDNEVIAQLQKVIGMVRNFWRDDNFPHFLVTLKPYDRDHGSSDGSAFTNAFWMYVSRLDSFAGLLPQLAHEAFHAWNPGRMGTLSAEACRTTTWFYEGFTSYYGSLLVYRAGALPMAKYVDSLNRDLRQFMASTDPYVRGRVIALWLDGAIRHESRGEHSLDDVMLEMVRTGSQPLTLARILETAGRYLSPDARRRLQGAVVDYEDLAPPEEAPSTGGCAQSSLKELPTFEVGLDLALSCATNQISGVVEGGPAFAAGLRDGQALAHVSISIGDPDRLARFTIRTDAGEQQVKLYPRGKKVAVWQYRLDHRGSCGPVP